MDQLAVGIAWYVAFLLSVTLHEASHAWVAMRGGDLTAYEAGQVSLDPMPHIQREPLGMVVFPLLTFALNGFMMGWASAPYDRMWARSHPKRAAWMALAGPASNLILAVLAGLVVRGLIAGGQLRVPDRIGFSQIVAAPEATGLLSAVALFLSLMFSLNLLLFVLNMIPLPPLDGSSAIALFMSEDSAIRLQEFFEQPMLAMFGILGAFLLVRRMFGPVWDFGITMLYPELFG